ncbi:unnamed protein product [Haemonchus placei]|uniref:non-specific serine/threonine protein kinase n=1 Tax=Haemonchus placei TaxID=6290 RepID=A0A158QQ92_HAEPC|nr:unnamed protein product [Haemonchus placei]
MDLKVRALVFPFTPTLQESAAMKTRNQLNSSRRSFRTRPSVQFPVILVDNHHVKESAAMKTRNQLNSSRRSFRTRPSVQFPVILVDNHQVKLFGDDSFDDDFALRSPATRKPTKKKEEPPKVFTNITNRPAIAEEFNEENEQEKLNEELNAAADFSLYIENEDGERMKAVGNKLVKYDEFYGIKPSESNSRKKSFEESLSVKKYNQSDEYTKKLCKAICAAAGVRSKKSSGPFTTPSVSVGPAKERLSHMRPLSRASKAPDPIEELPESDSVETLQVDTSNKENEEDTGAMATMDFATTPKGRPSASEARERSFMTVVAENDDLAGSSVRPHSLRNLPASPIPDLEHMQEPEYDLAGTSVGPHSLRSPPASPIPDLEHMQEPECLRTPLLNTVPQAQSTPLSERFEYPNSNRAALNQVSRRESFDVSDCDMPAIPSTSMARSKGTEPDSPCGDELQTSSDDSRLADAFDSSLQLAPRHDNSCGSVDTLAEVRTELSIDIPYYLHGCADFNTSTPLSQLLFVIGQPRVIEWQNLPKDVFCGPRKLGEGVYGEVFATTYNGEPTALKVIPFQGDTIVYKEKVNGEYLLDATSILPEVLINRELSALFDPSADFSTPNFIKLLHTHVVKGLYPEEFMKAWNEFDEANGSENDPPSNYASEQQLFVAMGMAMGGVDLEHYQMKNEDQVVSVLLQVALSLVVAEERLQFEHRDLHIGNALVLESNDDVEYRYGGGDMVLRSYGLKVHLIDFTLSRLSKEGTTIFRDLESDEELFAGSGDYQFDIYRMMRHSNEGDWLAFNPKSNCFWMHYLAVQLISKRKCKKAIPKKRQRELQKMWDNLLRFESVKELFTHDDFYDILQRHLIIKPQSIQIE